MKTYLKRSQKKSLTLIYYSSVDVLTDISSRVDFRQKVVQPSTKEQQRLLSAFNTPTVQHVHTGKYGIKPLDPSEKIIDEQEKIKRKLSKVMQIFS